ncbi:MAG: endonuclease/exonuclease/phosphatase family protein [Chlamydiales bacterium]|nr:endonuclease/exonuclease/phosphatase family protein [Chlamydiales bacterium]
MEEISPNFHAESTLDYCAEKLQYGANIMRGVMWNAQAHFMVTWGALDQAAGSRWEKVASCVQFAWGCGVGMFGLLLLGLSHRLQSREYTYWRGEGVEVFPDQEKVMHLNACMFPGSLPYHFGKQAPASERMGSLASRIQEKDPELLFLCEFSPVFSEELYENLKGEYKHFFVNIGSCAQGMDASIAVISKVPILKAPQFIPTKIPAEGDQKLMYRGYFIIETQTCKYLYTHLHAKDTEGAKTIRKEQLEEIRSLTTDSSKPWVVLGDLNIDRNKQEYKNLEGFNDIIHQHHGKVTTCSEEGVEESIDYVLTRDERLQVVTEVIQDLKLSDHSIITATISLA